MVGVTVGTDVGVSVGRTVEVGVLLGVGNVALGDNAGSISFDG